MSWQGLKGFLLLVVCRSNRFGALVEASGWIVAGYWLIPFALLGFLAGWLVKVR